MLEALMAAIAINRHLVGIYGAEIVEMLLNAGAEDDIEGAIHRARELNKPRILKVLEEHIERVRI